MINLSQMGGYTPIANGRGLSETSATAGRRSAHGASVFGVSSGRHLRLEGRGIDDVEPVADVATQQGGASERHFNSIDLRQTPVFRSRWGLTGSGDYQLSHASNIHVRGLFSDFKNYGQSLGLRPDRQHSWHPAARCQRVRHGDSGSHRGALRRHSNLQQFNPAAGYHDRNLRCRRQARAVLLLACLGRGRVSFR